MQEMDTSSRTHGMGIQLCRPERHPRARFATAAKVRWAKVKKQQHDSRPKTNIRVRWPPSGIHTFCIFPCLRMDHIKEMARWHMHPGMQYHYDGDVHGPELAAC